MSTLQTRSAVFAASAYRAVELREDDAAELQRFLVENPEYFLAAGNQAPHPSLAQELIVETPPEGWPYSRKILIGFLDRTGALIGIADVVCDLLAAHVWHIGLFILASRLHGKGIAQILYGALERWAAGSGARWMRLGVIAGNLRAERFWDARGFVELRRRDSVPMGLSHYTIRTLVKPLAEESIERYLELVERDRPGSSD